MRKLKIYFDNQTYKLNNIIINYIKRWIIYKIINDCNKYKEICVCKTYPNFVKKKINISDIENNIVEILTWINNIIYKKYDEYEEKNFFKIFSEIFDKDVFDEMKKNIDNKDDKDEVIIFTSRQDKLDIDKFNNKLIENVILKSNIKLVNISDNFIFENIFPSIDEYIIDVNSLKMENININQIININLNNNIYNFDDELNKYKNFDLQKTINEFKYLKLLYVIESFININSQNNKLKKNLQNDSIEQILKNVKITSINNHSILTQNIFKSYKNAILNLLQRHNKFNVNLPIDTLTSELNASYIKYILEFYSVIYPKIYNYNLTYSSNKVFRNKHKNNSMQFSQIKLKNIKEFDLDPNDISIDYLKSTLTITNWKEEYENANPFGILIKYIPCKLSYKGIFDFNSSILKTYPNMVINDVTTNFVPLYDYYQIVLFDYENKKENSEDGEDSEDSEEDSENNINDNTKFFTISKFNIYDNVNGDGNVLLPLYINKHHWELVKSLWTYHLSFINNCYEHEYNIKMDNVYFMTVFKLFGNLKNKSDDINTKLLIVLFGNMLRTCIQILIDNKFLHNIKKDYVKYMNMVLNANSLDKNSLFADWIIRTIQLIISNGINDEELNADLEKVTGFIFKKYIISNYKMDYWDEINNSNIEDADKKNKLKSLKEEVLQDNMCWLFLNFDLKIFNKIIKSIYKINGFNQFIKQIDKTNGCLPDTNNIDTLNIKTFENIINVGCKTQFNLNDYKVDISSYCENFKLDEIIV